jgi:hypothetical protein
MPVQPDSVSSHYRTQCITEILTIILRIVQVPVTVTSELELFATRSFESGPIGVAAWLDAHDSYKCHTVGY